MNLSNWLIKSAKQHPNSPALLSGQTIVATYSEFAQRSAALAGHLQAKCNLSKGDRVAVFLPNCTQYLEILYGIWMLGAVAVPINAKLHPKEAAWIIADAGANTVFSSQAYLEQLADILPACTEHSIAVDLPSFAELYQATPLPSPVAVLADDLVWLFYTSGTTGKPKGVMLSSANLTATVLSYFADVDDVQQDHSALYAAPMSHGAGLYNFMFVIKAARHVVPISGGFDADEILDLAPHIQNLSMFAAPTMVRRLVDAARRRDETGEGIKTIVYGGGPMYFADIVDAVEVMGPRFVQILGQGECPMAISVLSRDSVSDRSHANWQDRLAGVGVAQSVVDVEIHGPDGQPVPAGDVGEICVFGLPVMQGYWKNPQATQETIVSGWLKTGDLGVMDKDGFIKLHDRSKDVIISGGSNIYPREVEEVLLTHPNVSEVSVIGVPDPEWGEIVVACIVAPGASQTQLDAFCNDNIARFKRPKRYRFMDSLPQNAYGKVLKTDLRAALDSDA